MEDLPAWSLTGVLCVYVCAHAHALHWSGVPSVLQGRGLFPGNWVVQKPGRSSQQWGGNTRPVTLLVISKDKAEKRWDKLCVHVWECARARKWLHNSVYVEGVSHLTTSPKCPLPIQAVEVDSTWLVYTPVSSFLTVYFRRPVCWQQPSYQLRACSSMCPWRPSLQKRMSSHWNNAEVLVKCWKKAIYGIFLTNHSKRNPSPLLFICLHCKTLSESSWSFYRLFFKPSWYLEVGTRREVWSEKERKHYSQVGWNDYSNGKSMTKPAQRKPQFNYSFPSANSTPCHATSHLANQTAL